MEYMAGQGQRFDAIITDPPYGIDYEYEGYEDTHKKLKDVASHFEFIAKFLTDTMAVFAGVTTIDLWSHATWRMAWVRPNGNNRHSWGFGCWTPIAVYGKDPYLAAGQGARPDVFIDYRAKREPGIDHPAVKPLSVMRWLIQRVAPDALTILDPFCGSGSTGVACMQFGINFVGIEINPKYAAIAEERVGAASRQLIMF